MTNQEQQKPPEHSVWRGMKERCQNPNHVAYHRYGGRGISVCDRWSSSFRDFLLDMGSRPSAVHTLERENNDGNYEPGNTRWATPKEQGRNRTNNVTTVIDGKTETVSALKERTGIDAGNLRERIRKGYTGDKLFSPVNKRSKQPRHAPHSKYHLVSHDGRILTIFDLSKETGIALATLKARARKGDTGDFLTRPVGQRR